jgi:hypothetical protein
LNDDGSQKLDSNGNPIPTYSNTDVMGLGRGVHRIQLEYSRRRLRYMRGRTAALRWPGIWRRASAHAELIPSHHSTVAEAVSRRHHPSPAARSRRRLKIALDTLFNHPNLPPFFCKQMIQHLVTSNPSPTYIGNCSAGLQERWNGRARQSAGGDLGDPARSGSARFATDFNNPQYGKVRESLLRYTEWARAFTAQSRTGSYRQRQHRRSHLGTRRNVAAFAHGLQLVCPGIHAAGHAIAAAGLVAPEMQMTNVSSVVGYINYMQGAIGAHAAGGPDIFSSTKQR